jgi:hypothetical protein
MPAAAGSSEPDWPRESWALVASDTGAGPEWLACIQLDQVPLFCSAVGSHSVPVLSHSASVRRQVHPSACCGIGPGASMLSNARSCLLACHTSSESEWTKSSTRQFQVLSARGELSS